MKAESASGPRPRTADAARGVPLTPAQRRVWFATHMFPLSAEHIVHATVELPAPLSQQQVTTAVRVLATRHEALRLRFTQTSSGIIQNDSGTPCTRTSWHDLGTLPLARARERADQVCAEAVATPPPPDQSSLFRVEAMSLPDGTARLLVVAHRLIADDWSLAMLCAELAGLLDGAMPGPQPPRFTDYAASLAEDGQQGQRQAESADYWLTELRDPPVLDIPADKPRPMTRGTSIARAPFTVPAAVAEGLHALGDEEGASLEDALLAAFAILLLRLSGQADVIVGCWAADHDLATSGLAGCVAQTVALRARLAGAVTFREALRRVQAAALTARHHQAVPQEDIVARLGLPREAGLSPLFQAFFAFRPRLPGDPGRTVRIGSGSGAAMACDLALVVDDAGEPLAGFLEYSPDLLSAGMADRYAHAYARLLEAMATVPDTPVREHPLVSATDRDRILNGLNAYARPAHPYRTMAQPFEEQAERTPDAIALVGQEGSLTYRELNDRANRLARFLRAAGADGGTRVALCLERSFHMVTALYAVAKSGAAYLPLDTELPAERLAFMLEDAEPLLVLTDAASRHLLPDSPWRCVVIDGDDGFLEGYEAGNLDCHGPATHLIHLLYTSGSTGRPKAVAYPVDGAIADIMWLQRSYPFHPGDTALLKTSYGFDVSIWEIFWPLYFGARVAICPPGRHGDPYTLQDLIEHHEVTTIFLIPTLMRVFLDALRPAACPSLRWVFCGGEPVTPWIRETFHRLLTASLINCYGPTEAGCVTDMVLPPDPGSATVPLGRPAPNFRFYVLDERREVVPIGVPGEVYLGGEVGLACGYFRRPGLTAERFVPDPFGPPGSRMYQTGDVCRYREDGVLEHLGRIGRQVKIRGMRVELAEVEQVFCEHEAVTDCVVHAVGEGGERDIIAFIVPGDDASWSPEEMLARAGRLLPRHMLPKSVVPVSHIPSNVNGKTDFGALVRAWREQSQDTVSDLVPPSGEVETKLAAIYQRVLGTSEISATDNFIERGGHSLLVFKLLEECEQEMGVRPEINDVLTATVRELAAILESPPAASPGGYASLVPLRPGPGPTSVIFIHAASGSALPFMPVAMELSGDLPTYALAAPDDAVAGYSIEDLAARYMREIESAVGTDPLALVGWSMGGCVALEMTRRWRARDREVAATVMLDTWLPPAVLPSASDRARATAAIWEMDVLGPEEGTDDARLGPATNVDRLRQVVSRNKAAFLDYHPAAFDGKVVLLRADEEIPAVAGRLPGEYLTEDHGWRRRITDLQVTRLPGNHFTVTSQAHAAALAASIREVLGQVRDGG